MKSAVAWATIVVSFGCSSGHTTSHEDGGTGSGGEADTGGAHGSSGGSTGASSGGAWKAGTTGGTCKAGLPAEAKALDTSKPATVVGTGTAASCDFATLDAAVKKGGVVTFDCGDAPVTIAVTATLAVKTDTDTVIDGKRLVTLDGGGKVQLLSFDSPGGRRTSTG